MSRFRYSITNTKESVPTSTAGTGTIDTFGLAIVGTGTAFLTEMIAGSWLVDLAQDECRRVVRVDSDTKAFLEKPFTADLTADTPSIIGKFKASPKEISLKIKPADADGELDGEVFSGVLTLSKSNADHSGRFDLIDPVVVDATGTSIYISVLY